MLATCVSLLAAPLQAGSVLLIIADDLGRDSLALFNGEPGASLPPTPTIDQLGASGIVFDRMYAYSSCSPTRASILTGRYEFRTGVYSPEINELQPNEFTLAEAIVSSGAIGQRLALLGKWHLGGDADAPATTGGWPYYAGHLGGGLRSYNLWSKTVNGVTTDRYTTYATTDQVNDAINWISAQGTDDWFLWLAFNAPHEPFHKPDNALHSYDYLSGSATDIANNPRPYYEAMVEAMDSELARLLEVVDLTTTTVIFIGDNGTPNIVLQPPFPGGHGKGSLYEGGVNVPMIVSGAAIPENLKGTGSEAIIHSVDLYRTILDLLGIDQSGLLPKELVYDSESFYPLLSGASSTHTRTLAYTGQPSTTSVRQLMLVDENYKWIQNDDGSEEFYYLSDGIEESTNRINSLDGNASATLAVFQTKLGQLENTPTIQRVYFDEAGDFNIELGWYASASFSLESRSDLGSGSWESADGFTLRDGGDTVLTLTQTATGTQGFYRVSSD